MEDGDKGTSGATPREIASEDFLYHLYRGSELLQDDRVHEAKEELEAALSLQPRDAKGQDLLALVYFRIGLYPRAIQIYEELRKAIPNDTSLMVNLALCCLKTAQTQSARVLLEELVRAVPEHKRAWGYLGLAYERQGDFDKAEESFSRGGHSGMARRVGERRSASLRPPPAERRAEPAMDAESRDIRAAAAVAFQELDAGELSFALAAPALRRTESGTWRAVEIGEAVKTPGSSERPPPPPTNGGSPVALPAMRAPRPFAGAERDAHLVPLPGELVSQHGSGLVLVASDAPDRELFAGRLDALRGYTGSLTTRLLDRQTRAVSHEPFGGLGAPLARIKSSGSLVFGPRAAHRLVPLKLDDDVAFLREDHILGFDLRLAFENGRLGFGETDAMPFVQLKGTGVVVVELLDPLVVLDVAFERSAVARREAIVGWTGRLVPRALGQGEAPSGQRGLVSFAGEGSLLLSSR